MVHTLESVCMQRQKEEGDSHRETEIQPHMSHNFPNSAVEKASVFGDTIAPFGQAKPPHKAPEEAFLKLEPQRLHKKIFEQHIHT